MSSHSSSCPMAAPLLRWAYRKRYCLTRADSPHQRLQISNTTKSLLHLYRIVVHLTWDIEQRLRMRGQEGLDAVIAFRANARLSVEAEALAASEGISRSDVARRALLRDLDRSRHLIREPATEE